MSHVRKVGGNCALFTVGGTDYIDTIANCTLTITTKDAEGKAIREMWDDPQLTGGSWQITGEAMIDTVAALVAAAVAGISNISYLSVQFDSGANVYGDGATTKAILEAGHKVEREGLQMQTFTLKGKGVLPIT